MESQYELIAVAEVNRVHTVVNCGLRPTREVACNSAKRLYDKGRILRAFIREVVATSEFFEIELKPYEESIPHRPYIYKTFGD